RNVSPAPLEHRGPGRTHHGIPVTPISVLANQDGAKKQQSLQGHDRGLSHGRRLAAWVPPPALPVLGTPTETSHGIQEIPQNALSVSRIRSCGDRGGGSTVVAGHTLRVVQRQLHAAAGTGA